jgi:hypothetical protein
MARRVAWAELLRQRHAVMSHRGRAACPLVAALLPVCVGLAAIAGAPPAAADRAVSIGAGWATYSTLGDPPMPNKAAPTVTGYGGAHLELSYEHGISPEVSLRGELAAALFAEDGGAYLALGDLGVVYRFDVVKYVPYGFAGLGAVASTGEPIDSDLDLVVVLGGGLDILSSRTRSWGIEGRLASFASDTTVFTLGVRGTVRWGFF